MVLVIFMWYTRKKEVIKMEGKFNIWQKCLEIVCFVLILASSIYKGLFCDGDMGVVITLSFVAILLFIIFSKLKIIYYFAQIFAHICFKNLTICCAYSA